MSEIRSLLLTDVVDSTRLAQELGDLAMAEVWAGHDRVARELLGPWRGREIDKTDGMLLLFDSPADAVGYALAYHAALAALPVPLVARAGLHVGPVILQENSAADIARGAKPLEVLGLAKPIAARVSALALARQTLLSAEAREHLGATPLKVVSHGHWALKGVSEPVELFEVNFPDAPFQLPPDSDKSHRVVRVDDWWLPLRDIPNNLPHQPTSFIGRERERAEVTDLLGHSRLVTLLGMGGLGKTRLSLQVAAEAMHRFPDGVWFIDLAPISDPAIVVGETARIVGVREEPDQPVLATLCAHLKPRHALLILDNCEHLIDQCAALAGALLRAAPHVRLIASSRESLRVAGEQAFPVLPLSVPLRGDGGVEALLQSTAVRLFVDRARLHRPSFALGEREAPGVAELVARLEGIPLAIELAAARVRSLSIADINARLKDRYKLLTGGSRIVLPRQQTLRALVDWSYELLGPLEQIVLERLGVFVGGFDLAAAEHVCAGGPVDAGDVLDLLGTLVEKSVVMLEQRDDGARYRMLETIRDYAREKLERREDAGAVAARHCEHYFAMAKAANHQLTGPHQADWIWKVEIELDNVRSAVALSVAGGVDPFIAVKFAVALQGFWILRGYSTEGRALVRTLLALPAIQASTLARAWSLYVGAALAQSQSDDAEARQMLETCLALRRELGKEVDIAATLSTLSLVLLDIGDVAAATAGEEEALAIFQRLDDRRGQAICLLHLGQIRLHEGDDAGARADLDRCLAIAREIGHQEVEGACELMLGELAFALCDWEASRRHCKRSLTVCREAGDKRGEASALLWLGRLDLDSAELDASQARLSDALRAFRSFEMREELLCCLEDHAALALAKGSGELSASLSAASARSRERLSLKRSPRRERRWQEHLGRLRAALPDVRFDGAWLCGEQWTVDEAVHTALRERTQDASKGAGTGLPAQATATA